MMNAAQGLPNEGYLDGGLDFLFGLAKNGISRVVDAELDNFLNVEDTPQNFTDDTTGQTYRSGQPAPQVTMRAPGVGVTARAPGGMNTTMMIAAAAGLVLLLVVMRK